MSDHGLAEVLRQLRDASSAVRLADLPDERDHYYAVWVDKAGAGELTAVAPEPITTGIVYAGECVNQSVRRHLAHNDIGQLTLMKNLAALFRDSWRLRGTNHGARLLPDDGRQRLRSWMAEHLTVTVASRRLEPDRSRVLALLDPPLRLQGTSGPDTDLRRHVSAQRAAFDRD